MDKFDKVSKDMSKKEKMVKEKVKGKKEKVEKVVYPKGKKEKIITDEMGGKLLGGEEEEGVHDDHDDHDMNGEEDEEKMKLKAKKKSKQVKRKETSKTRASKAGIFFPVGRIHTKLKALVPTHCRVGGTAAVFIAAVVEYLVAELMELAGERAKKTATGSSANKKFRITPRLLQFAINDDPEYNQLLSRVTLSQGGVMPLTDKQLREKFVSGAKGKKLDIPGQGPDGGEA